MTVQLSENEREAVIGATENLKMDVATCVRHLKGEVEYTPDNKMAFDTIVFAIQYLADFTLRLAGVPGIDTTVAFQEFETENVVTEAERILRGES